MSKQLAISASVSIFAMAAFVLLATSPGTLAGGNALNQQGATTEVAAPLIDRIGPAILDILA